MVKIIFPESYPLNLPYFAVYENNNYRFVYLDPTFNTFASQFSCDILAITDRVYEPFFRQRDPSLPLNLWDLSFSSLHMLLVTYWFPLNLVTLLISWTYEIPISESLLLAILGIALLYQMMYWLTPRVLRKALNRVKKLMKGVVTSQN